MPDVARTIAQAIALLADNSTGNISPQDIRDTVMSLALEYGGGSPQTGLSLTLTNAGFASIFPGLSALTVARNFDINPGGRLRYKGVTARACFVLASVTLDLQLSAPPTLVSMRLTKNDAEIVGSTQRRIIDSPNGKQNFVLWAFVPVVTDDQFGIEARASSDTDYILDQNEMNIMAVALPG